MFRMIPMLLVALLLASCASAPERASSKAELSGGMPTLRLAPSAFGSLQTFATALNEENTAADLRDDVTTRWGAGVRVLGIPGRTTGDTRHPNPLPRHFIGLYFGDDEAVGHHRLMVDSALILDEGTGFFVGFGASMGRGEDDVRVILGFATTLHNVFTALSGLVPEVLK